mmetsp:Transcript_8411/g.25272  ORF Transcript_8411/g.25272 Transcript_8411/m.25272 type:complete len:561 (+) Transcript_8411:111-1793(+)
MALSSAAVLLACIASVAAYAPRPPAGPRGLRRAATSRRRSKLTPRWFAAAVVDEAEEIDFADAAALEAAAFKEVELPKEVLKARAWFEEAVAEAEADYPASPTAIQTCRAEGVSALERAILPERNAEPWRFTRLDRFWACSPVRGAPGAAVTREALADWLPADGEIAIVAVDGVVDAALSRHLGEAAGGAAWCGALSEAPPEVLRACGPMHAALPEVDQEEAIPYRVSLGAGCWCALNAACAPDAVVIYRAADEAAAAAAEAAQARGDDRVASASPELRAHVIHVRSRAGALHPRTVIRAGAGARVTVRESFVNLADVGRRSALTNARSSVDVGARADVAHVLDAQEPDQVALHHVSAKVGGAFGLYEARTLNDAAAVARLCIDCDVAAPGGHFDFAAVQLGGTDQNLDVRTALTHSCPDATSAQDFRNVAGDKSRLTFKGRIYVAQEAQRTDAEQICKSLVLSDDAQVDAMPSLEVIADDVACTHGATVADLDEEAVFYLESRGLGRPAARFLLIKAFCYELVQKTRDMLPPATFARLNRKLSAFEDQKTTGPVKYSSI